MAIDFENDFKPDLLEVAKRLGRTPTYEEYEANGKFSPAIIYSRKLGGWKSVLRQAGLTASKKRTREETSNDDLRNGMCKSHKNLVAVVNQLCLDCWFKQQTVNNLGKVADWQKVKALFYAQNSCCIYTKLELIPGVNAWLDHKIPRSKAGPNIVENLQWVDKDINQIKSNRTHEEFIEFCKIVFNYRIINLQK